MSTDYEYREARASWLAKALREAGVPAHKHGDQVQIPVDAAEKLLAWIRIEHTILIKHDTLPLNSEAEVAADQAAADAQWDQS